MMMKKQTSKNICKLFKKTQVSNHDLKSYVTLRFKQCGISLLECSKKTAQIGLKTWDLA
jgi:hypothetical protein